MKKINGEAKLTFMEATSIIVVNDSLYVPT